MSAFNGWHPIDRLTMAGSANTKFVDKTLARSHLEGLRLALREAAEAAEAASLALVKLSCAPLNPEINNR